MAWPTTGPDFNAWNIDLDKFMKVLSDYRKTPFWLCDFELKYLNVRIDTRDNAFVLTDRLGEKVSPDRVLAAIKRFNELY